MDVPEELLQVGLLLADSGLVTVLKKVAAAPASSVETRGVTGQEPGHEGGYGNIAGAEQHVCMVGHKRPCIAGRPSFRQESRQPINEVRPVVVSEEDLLSGDAPYDHMMERTCGIKAGVSWHEHLCQIIVAGETLDLPGEVFGPSQSILLFFTKTRQNYSGVDKG